MTFERTPINQVFSEIQQKNAEDHNDLPLERRTGGYCSVQARLEHLGADIA
jgi:hypothetical protein